MRQLEAAQIGQLGSLKTVCRTQNFLFRASGVVTPQAPPGPAPLKKTDSPPQNAHLEAKPAALDMVGCVLCGIGGAVAQAARLVARCLAILLQAGKRCAGAHDISEAAQLRPGQTRVESGGREQLQQQQGSPAAAVPTHPVGVAAGADGHDGRGCQPGGCLGQQPLPVLWALGPSAGVEHGAGKGSAGVSRGAVGAHKLKGAVGRRVPQQDKGWQPAAASARRSLTAGRLADERQGRVWRMVGVELTRAPYPSTSKAGRWPVWCAGSVRLTRQLRRRGRHPPVCQSPRAPCPASLCARSGLRARSPGCGLHSRVWGQRQGARAWAREANWRRRPRRRAEQRGREPARRRLQPGHPRNRPPRTLGGGRGHVAGAWGSPLGQLRVLLAARHRLRTCQSILSVGHVSVRW